MEFIWHDEKALKNLKKHGINFDEAKTVFLDEYARLKHDPDNSDEEDRYLLLGLSTALKLLVVVHVEIENDVIRIISARKATRPETTLYRRFK
jgi:uncharacterized protein